jgi:iron(III) transport system substrate-binding protein
MIALLLMPLLITSFLPPVFAGSSFTQNLKSHEDAKKATKLVFYTTMEFPQNTELIRLFAEKYPFWNIEVHPLETETLVKRILDEARSRVFTWDVLLGGGGSLQHLLEANLLISFHSPERRALSEALRDSEGYWSGYAVSPYVLAYNTNLVKEKDVPISYEHLLQARWKGSIAVDNTAYGLLRGLTATWGEDEAVAYLKQLSDQQPVMARGSITAVDFLHRGTVSLIIARAPVIQAYRDQHHSPIQWVSLDPVISQVEAVMLSARSPNPNAARLFVDFVLSTEGQTALAGVAQQVPLHRDRQSNPKKALRWYLEHPDKNVNFQHTVRLFRKIFRIP